MRELAFALAVLQENTPNIEEVPLALHVPKATSAPKLVHRHVTSAHQENSL